MTATSIRGAAFAQFVFQPQKRTAPRPRARPASHALTRIPTIASSCLPSTLVLAVSISVILGILGITPPTGHAKPVFSGITTALGIPRVGPDRFGRGQIFLYKKRKWSERKPVMEKKKLDLPAVSVSSLAAAGSAVGLGNPGASRTRRVAKRRRRLRAHLHRVRTAHRLLSRCSARSISAAAHRQTP